MAIHQAFQARLDPDPVVDRSASRMLVIGGSPTPNGDLHLGHLSGPYLSADIYVRALKLRGRTAYYITGTDDNQPWVAYKARQIGTTPQATADEYAGRIDRTLDAARIELAHYYRPNRSPYHRQMLQALFKQLYESGILVARDAPSLYCDTCQHYLFEVYVTGICPHCGAGSGGNTCEQCGRPNDCVDLIAPVCRQCGGTPGVRHCRRLYLPLSQHTEQLAAYHAAVKMKTRNRALCELMLQEGLPDVSASQVSDWGLPVPIKGFEGQTISAWVELGLGYLPASQELADRIGLADGWKAFWQSEEAEIVQFFGLDNCWYHTLMYPAMLQAYDPAIRLPVAFVANEFYRLDGQKFSTSRGHAIWGSELAAQASADCMRFYLAYSAPEAEETNFVLSEFAATVQRELIDSWQCWLHDLGHKLSEEYSRTVPAASSWNDDQRRFYHKLQRVIEDVTLTYDAETFSPQQAIRGLCDLVSTTRRFAKPQDHWRHVAHRADERRTAVALELLAAKTLALLAAPMMPDFATRLWSDLGFAQALSTGAWNDLLCWVPAGQAIGDLGRAYFPEVAHLLASPSEAELHL